MKEKTKQWLEQKMAKHASKDDIHEAPFDERKGMIGNCHGRIRNRKTGKVRPLWISTKA